MDFINIVKFEANWRTIAILHNALSHSISKQKFELMHVRRICRNDTDLNYPQLIDKLCLASKEFDQTVKLYNFLIDEFQQPDIASIHNKDFLWSRTKRVRKKN